MGTWVLINETWYKSKVPHFYRVDRAIPIVDPKNLQTGTLLFRTSDGLFHFSMPRQAFEQLAQEIPAELAKARPSGGKRTSPSATSQNK
jgi:hypothetical protein